LVWQRAADKPVEPATEESVAFARRGGALADTAVQQFYRFHARVYDSTRWMILHGRGRAAAALELGPSSQVLEIGCGTGLNFAGSLAYLDPGRGRLVGVDFSADMLARAARRVARHGWQNVELVRADATTLRLGREFDAVFFGYSLTMIPDWVAAVERALEHLQPGGRLVVLDFSRFHGWGPLAPVMRTWLRLNHVETLRPYEDVLRARLERFNVHYWLGGYNFVAAGRKGA
jgi:S-adenosylmethionine-diacylgycerolhomoserine-N-methlytransferase